MMKEPDTLRFPSSFGTNPKNKSSNLTHNSLYLSNKTIRTCEKEISERELNISKIHLHSGDFSFCHMQKSCLNHRLFVKISAMMFFNKGVCLGCTVTGIEQCDTNSVMIAPSTPNDIICYIKYLPLSDRGANGRNIQN